MKNSISTPETKSYAFRHIKTVFGPIAIYYSLVASFVSFILSYFSLMAFNDRESSLVLSTILNIIFFTILFRLNNYFAQKDQRTIDHLYVTKKYDTNRFLVQFYRDLRDVFSRNGQPYNGHVSDIAIIGKVNLLPLFASVFKERSADQFQAFVNVGGNFMEFIETMEPESKEVLFRHYIE